MRESQSGAGGDVVATSRQNTTARIALKYHNKIQKHSNIYTFIFSDVRRQVGYTVACRERWHGQTDRPTSPFPTAKDIYYKCTTI